MVGGQLGERGVGTVRESDLWFSSDMLLAFGTDAHCANGRAPALCSLLFITETTVDHNRDASATSPVCVLFHTQFLEIFECRKIVHCIFNTCKIRAKYAKYYIFTAVVCDLDFDVHVAAFEALWYSGTLFVVSKAP